MKHSLVIFAVTTLLVTRVTAATPPTGFSDTLVAGGISNPSAMAFAPDGRIFVCQQTGGIRVVKDGALLPTPFLTLNVDPVGERGLLGIAFDPKFDTNQYLYLYYTVPSMPRFNRISRFTASGDTVLAGSELPIFRLPDLSGATNHNGGAMHFGPDGKLYVAVGENANPALAQSLSTLMGKMLRLNTDGSIPADNPFFGSVAGDLRAMWALGLRNPFTFAFHPTNGRLLINDVGQGSWEEINEGAAAANYGWPNTEGDFNQVSFPNFTRPFAFYRHGGAQPQGCAITGGTFYQPASPTFPADYLGDYFFADFCSNWIYRLDVSDKSMTQFLTGASSVVDLKVGPDAALYYLQRGGGGQLRRVQVSNLPPTITTDPASITRPVGVNAAFTVQATGADLAYQWQRNSVNIPSATDATYTLVNPQLTDSGALFRVVVTNPNGSVTSNAALLTVTPNQAPSASILTPAAGSLFSAGDTISFSGSANDPETGAIAASSFRWRVDYITGAATRPFLPEFTGATGSFTVPAQTPYTLTDVYFLIYLTVTDPQGFTTTVTRRVDPRVATHSLRTIPNGLQVTLDGTPGASPRGFGSVVGLQRAIGAPSPQVSGGTRALFASWSDGGGATHTITAPISDTTYTATFNTEYLLTTVANPAGGGTVSPGGWFAAGATVPLVATAGAGWTFSGFSGDLAGPVTPQNLAMNAPKSVTANFQPLPSVLMASMTGRANGSTPSERRWRLLVRNVGSGPAVDARVTGATIRVIGGSAAVSLLTPLPVLLGNIPAGGGVPLELLLQFPATTPPTRVSLTLQFTNSLGAAGSVTLNNLFR